MNRLFFDNSLKYRIGRHTVFFLTTVFIFTGILVVQNKSGDLFDSFSTTLINALFFFGYAYITIFLLIPEFLIKRKIVWFILLFLLTGIGLSSIKLISSDYIFYSSISPENIQRNGILSLRFILVNTKDMTFIVALFCIVKYVKDYIYAERTRQILEKQNKEAQRKLLQSQFDPHFLFNTINNLYALSLLNPLKTNDIISKIKIVLKYIVDESSKNFVELKDEISLVENYIQLEKLRYGTRLKVGFKTEGEMKSVKVPPMVLFILVENCFKHGSSLDAGNPWIKINVSETTEAVRFTVENSKPAIKTDAGLIDNIGSGLKNLKKRLEIAYPNNGFDLNIENRKNSFFVNLELIEAQIEVGRKKYR